MTSASGEAVTTADRSWTHGDAAFFAGLFAVSLALRVAVVFAFSAPPTWDGAFYHRGAISIAQGYGYSEAATIAGHAGRLPWSHYPVGYSALLGAIYRLFGSGLHVAPLVNSLVGALTAVVVYLFGLEILGRRRARIAGALLALHPGLILYCTLVMTEPLAGFLMLLAGYLACKLGRYRWGAVLCGVVVALSAFVRPQSLLAAPLLLLLFRGTWARRCTQLALAGLVSVCVIAPWSVRNCLVLDGCAVISTNGGWNLAISALSESGRFRPLTPADGCAGVDGPVAQDRCWAEVGVAAIERDPWTWLSRIPRKLSHTYNHESFAIAYLAEAQPGAWQREHEWRVMNLMTGLHHLLMFAAALGAVSRFWGRSWRQRWPQAVVVAGLVLYDLYALSLPDRPLYWVGVLIPVLGFLRLPGAPPLNAGLAFLFGLLAVTSLTHMVFFGDDRYHLAISPVFCLLAAAAFRAPARSRPPLDAARFPSASTS
ncbi:MAG TPA: glycosyltransferase family 39 protein [Polyangiaceae bacterium]|jgi:4-amino-4-deoxy-L-arabinose transferase-like glycosyltransferase|nr:glycosyltransferase family 39 protein [Polyangiaceae bacterium]